MLINGCQEGKGTPKLTEVKCPKCGAFVDVFVRLGGPAREAGTLVSDEKCACGYLLKAGTYEEDYNK